jgi:hypothetical protein
MANLVIKPASGSTNKLVFQNQAGNVDAITVEDSGAIAVAGNMTLSGSANVLGTVTSGTIGSAVTGNSLVKAWGRIEDNVLTSSLGISGISVATGNTRFYTVTLSPAMSNDDYAVVTCAYAHEGGAVEGTFGIKTGAGAVYPTTTSFMLEYKGNSSAHIDCLGFAVFGT